MPHDGTKDERETWLDFVRDVVPRYCDGCFHHFVEDDGFVRAN